MNAFLEITKGIASGLCLGDVLHLIVTVTAKRMDVKICSTGFSMERTRSMLVLENEN
jgi:hypothetical protein